MKSAKRTLYRVLLIALAFVSIVSLGILISGQEAPTRKSGLIDDWSGHHLVFSNPGTAVEALRTGTMEKWYKITNDPRYQMQQLKRSLAQRAESAPGGLAARVGISGSPDDNADADSRMASLASKVRTKKDWSMDMGPTATVGAGQYPAKFSNNTSTANCASATPPDYVAFNTGTNGKTTATGSVTIGTVPSAGFASTTTVKVGTITYTFVTGLTGSTANEVLENTSSSATTRRNDTAGNLRAAIDDSASECVSPSGGPCFLNNGSSANSAVTHPVTLSADAISLTAATAGPGGDFTVSTNNTADITASETNGGDQASIISFYNLYSGCTTPPPVPAPYWAYDTGGLILTSVALSNDGTQLAFVHSSASGSSLVLLHWKAGEGASAGSGSAAAVAATPAATYTSSTVASWVSCRAGTTSCQLNLPFSGTAANVTQSAPYYDSLHDQLYVGDDNGVLHKFTGVFAGTPGELSTGGWPVTVHSGTVLTGPVSDGNTNNVFVGDSSGRLSYVRDTGSTTGACGSGSPPCLGSTSETLTTGPIADGPLVDPSEGTVYAFSGVTSKIAAYEVLQSNESLSTSSSITFSGISGRTYTSNARIGTFDNIYYTSGPATGHLYVCAPDNDGSSFYNGASLYEIGFTSGVMNTTAGSRLPMVSASPASGSTVDDCSPLTEFYDGTTDYLFLGVAEFGSLTGCTGSATAGCVYNFNITSSFPSNSVAGLTETGNTSGMVIDNNVSSSSGGSQIYFAPLASQSCSGNSTPTGNGTGGCAVQASQSAP